MGKIEFQTRPGSYIYTSVKWFRMFLGTLFLAFIVTTARAQSRTEVSLLLASDSARPGDIVMAGVRLHMRPHWHTYWRNPGGSGIATHIKWQLPPGITAGDVQWPLPEKLPAEELTTYIYNGDVVLLVPLKLASNLAAGPLKLQASVTWLECEKLCVPGKTDVQATLTIGSENKSSADAATLDLWKQKIPAAKPDLAAHATWEKTATGDARPLVLEWPATATGKDFDFFPFSSETYDVQPATEILTNDAGQVRIRKIIKKVEGDWPTKIPGLIIEKTDDHRVGVEVNLSIGGGATMPSASALPPQSLALMLLYALIGGLILNVMPCVLPVVSLKILGFVNQAQKDPKQIRKLGLLYTAGVIVSFLVLAGIVIGVKAVGQAASWGMQFQNPQFVVVMTVLVSLVALNLFGVFEINLSGRVMGTAGNLAARDGYAGAFLNGVLATILATPCTAPFLGAALGFAFAQPPAIIVLIFLCVGVGLAAPYFILCCQPAWLHFLPKPGAWMERFKVAMGFPMLATALWLFTLAAPNFGEDGDLWLGLFLVLLALTAWIWGQFVQRGRSRRGLATVICVVILIAAYAFLMEAQLNWRHPVSAGNGNSKSSADGIDWKEWSPETLAAARASGRPIIVDFTAKWCLTCQANKKTSIEIPRVRAKLKEINAIALIENSYVKSPTVVAELNRYQRAGVPLVLVYPKNPDTAPEVLPELLTPSTVLDALDRAAK